MFPRVLTRARATSILAQVLMDGPAEDGRGGAMIGMCRTKSSWGIQQNIKRLRTSKETRERCTADVTTGNRVKGLILLGITAREPH